MEEQLHVDEQIVTNGLNVTEYNQIVTAVAAEPQLARFEFRAHNRWIDGGLNRTTIGAFFGAGEEHGGEDRDFILDAAEPPVLLGDDEAPNPVEYLLHSLAACLTSSIVYKAASRGIVVESIESTLRGDLNAQRFLELTDVGRTGYEHIWASFKVKSEAPAEELEELAKYSPVFDVISNGTTVSLSIEKV